MSNQTDPGGPVSTDESYGFTLLLGPPDGPEICTPTGTGTTVPIDPVLTSDTTTPYSPVTTPVSTESSYGRVAIRQDNQLSASGGDGESSTASPVPTPSDQGLIRYRLHRDYSH